MSHDPEIMSYMKQIYSLNFNLLKSSESRQYYLLKGGWRSHFPRGRQPAQVGPTRR